MPNSIRKSSFLEGASRLPEGPGVRAVRGLLASYNALVDVALNAWTECVPRHQRVLLREALWPGRRTRSSLLLALADESSSGESSKIDLHSSAVPLAVAVELLHRASIITDDMIDGDSMRRLSPALHVAEGMERASTCVHILISSAFSRLSALGGPAAAIIADTYERMASAQLAELDATLALAGPLECYKQHVLPKTSALFGAVFELAGSIRQEPVHRIHARNVGEMLGRLYQMQNDYYDVAVADTGVRGWKRQHRLTVDLITAVASEEDDVVRELLVQRRALTWRQRKSVAGRLRQENVLAKALSEIAAEREIFHETIRTAPPKWRCLGEGFAAWTAQQSFWDHRELESAGY